MIHPKNLNAIVQKKETELDGPSNKILVTDASGEIFKAKRMVGWYCVGDRTFIFHFELLSSILNGKRISKFERG